MPSSCQTHFNTHQHLPRTSATSREENLLADSASFDGL